MIYLDNAATTPIKPEVIDVITDILKNHYGNPSSSYNFGIESKKIIESSRKTIANKLGCEPEEIIFTSGACESNSMMLQNVKNLNLSLVTTELEHKSILQGIDLMEDYFGAGKNHCCNFLGNDMNGFVDLKSIETISYDCLMSIQYANNEIGTIQDMKAISDIACKKGIGLHSDITQMIANAPVNVNELELDMASMSGQKIGAPKGIGIFFIKKDIPCKPIIFGSQENGRRGGTENIAYIAGLAKAFELLDYSDQEDIKAKRDYLWKEIKEAVPYVSLNGASLDEHRLNNNLNICFKDVNASGIITQLDTAIGCCVSAGSACNAGNSQPSKVLKAIRLSDQEANSSVRFTLNASNTYEELDSVVKVLKFLCK